MCNKINMENLLSMGCAILFGTESYVSVYVCQNRNALGWIQNSGHQTDVLLYRDWFDRGRRYGSEPRKYII